MRSIAVRRAQPEDAAAIRAINAAGRPGVAPLTPHELDSIAGGATRCWVAEEPGEIIGYLIAYAIRDVYDGEEFAWFRRRYPAFLYIDQVAVVPGSRRAGVGSRLYQVAEDAARTQGLDALCCEVNLEPPNPISLSFHRRLGFRDVGVLRTQDGRTVALLHLPLPAVAVASPPV
jgi:uncharacterized protein